MRDHANERLLPRCDVNQAVNILRGPELAVQKPAKGRKTQPTGWVYGVVLRSEMASAVDRIALETGSTVSDVLRTALKEFLTNHSLIEQVNQPANLVADQAAPPSVTQPREIDGWRGNGRSDFRRGQASSAATRLRHAQGRDGERVKDSATAREQPPISRPAPSDRNK